MTAQEPQPPAVFTVPPRADPQLPQLTLHLQVAPDPVVLHAPVTVTVTIANQSPHPAHELRLMLPTPAGAVANPDPARLAPDAGWRWELGTLPSAQQATVTATVQLVRRPPGDALVLHPQATARGLDQPIAARGGALLAEPHPAGAIPPASDPPTTDSPTTDSPRPAPRGHGAAPPPITLPVEPAPAAADRAPTDAPAPAVTDPAPGASAAVPAPTGPGTTTGGTATEVIFTPGTPVTLRSPGGRIEVQIPAHASDRVLRLRHRFPAAQEPLLRATGAPALPPIAGLKRGFGAFYLDAVDDQGQAVHQFATPLTFVAHYTPQQLDALGIAPADLQFFWFDPDQRVARADGSEIIGQWTPLPTVVDPEARTATVQVDHFSAFQLSDGSSPSDAYLPSLQGWQVSAFTGAASFRYPLELPAGPNG
ncbi:MAG: hypothetical protein MI924_10780, partial [Chloroflexales bacterium]|nr:hypothetical protein [Chloroflexales bacterium]